MPLTLAKETMEMDRWACAAEQTGQILLEGDMIVPDSKPDLQKLLRCRGEVTLREQRVAEDRVSFSGEMEVTLLYTAKNGEHALYAMQSAMPLEDFLHMDGLEPEMEVTLTATVEHLDCRIINDRKIGVKAVIRIDAAARCKKTTEVLRDVSGEGVQCLRGTLQTERETAALRDRFPIKEEVTIAAVKPQIAEILWQELRLTEQELRPMDGKVMVRGTLALSLLYTDANGAIGSLAERIPFSGYLEAAEVSAATTVEGTLQIAEARLTPAVDEDGESRRLLVDVSVAATLCGRESVERELLLDAYAPEGNAVLKRETVTYPITVAAGKNQFTIKESIRLENGEHPILGMEEIWGTVRLSEARAETDAMQAEGVLEIDLLYNCANDSEPLCMLHRGIPFTQTMERKGVAAGDTVKLTLRLEDLDFQILSEEAGELRATITMEGTAQRQETAEWVTDLTLEDAAAETGQMAGAVIYPVQQGDTLWKIAKRYRTTVEDILAVNEIETPERLYAGQKLLIIKSAR